VRVVGDFTSSGLGYIGWLCGDSVTGRYYGVAPETDGSVVFIDGGYDGVEPLERYDALDEPTANGAKTTMGLECFVDHGTVWLEEFLNDGTTVALHAGEASEVTRFDVVGAYGEALEPGFTMSVTNVTAVGSGGATGALPLDVAHLIDQVPEAYRVACTRPPSLVDRANPSARCFVQDEGDGAEVVDVSQFADREAMNAAFDAQLGSAPSGPCATPAAQSTWSTATGNGRYGCKSLPFGMSLVWTDEATNVLGSVVDLEGDYSKTFAQWSLAVETPSAPTTQ
jgi:hypothetical protein